MKNPTFYVFAFNDIVEFRVNNASDIEDILKHANYKPYYEDQLYHIIDKSNPKYVKYKPKFKTAKYWKKTIKVNKQNFTDKDLNNVKEEIIFLSLVAKPEDEKSKDILNHLSNNNKKFKTFYSFTLNILKDSLACKYVSYMHLIYNMSKNNCIKDISEQMTKTIIEESIKSRRLNIHEKIGKYKDIFSYNTICKYYGLGMESFKMLKKYISI
ncbi:MAG: hypothetical protein N2505_00050 [Endomicrobia bacterium]|nr:hypothetical protein [Endomicrobiia bacterium]